MGFGLGVVVLSGTFFNGTFLEIGIFLGGTFCATAAEVKSKQARQVAIVNHEERIIILTPAFGGGCELTEHTP